MDSSGFLTLVAVILTALSLLSRGKKVTYWHKFNLLHGLIFFTSSLTVLYCLFYKTLKANNLLLPFEFIQGFDEEQLLLLISIVLLAVFLVTISYGKTSKSRLKSLCRNIDYLHSEGAFGDLIYVLNENKKFFMVEHIKNKDTTKKTLGNLILSKKLTSHLHDMDFQLYLYLLRQYAESDASIRGFKEYIYQQLESKNSYLMKEALLLLNSCSPRIPSDETPVLKTLYSEKNPTLRYAIYSQIGECLNTSLNNNRVVSELNTSPYNVQSDKFIAESVEFLSVFIFFNLMKNDIRNNIELKDGDSMDVRAPWIFTKQCFRPMIDARSSLIKNDDGNEFDTRIDYLVYDVFRTYRDICNMKEMESMNVFDRDCLIENIAYSYYYVINSGKFDIELTKYLLAFCVEIFEIIQEIDLNLANKFAFLSARLSPHSPQSS